MLMPSIYKSSARATFSRFAKFAGRELRNGEFGEAGEGWFLRLYLHVDAFDVRQLFSNSPEGREFGDLMLVVAKFAGAAKQSQETGIDPVTVRP
jgi:hypothetical protein